MEEIRASRDFRFKMDFLNMSVSIEEPSLIYESKTHPVKNMHYHGMYELFFIKDNALLLHTDEGVFEYKNCLLLVPPFFKHMTEKAHGQRILFSFDKSEKSKGEFARFMKSFFSPQTPFSFLPDSKIYFYESELSSLLHSKSPLTDEIIISHLKTIFYSIYTTFSKTKLPPSRLNESYAVKIDNLLSKFQSDINLQSVADVLCLSRKQASRIIRKNYKKTLSELLCEKRLAAAAELLERSDKTISEIVEFVNFPSESYFYAQFKKAYGCTPLKYKKQNI